MATEEARWTTWLSGGDGKTTPAGRPAPPSRSVVRDPLFLLMTGFASGSLASFFLSAFIGYHGPFAFLLLAAISLLALLLCAGW